MSIEYPESYLCDILNEVRTIAVVGASSKKHRDSYKVMQSLIENGYKVFPINPNESRLVWIDRKHFIAIFNKALHHLITISMFF